MISGMDSAEVNSSEQDSADNRIRWSDAEKTKLAQECARLRISDLDSRLVPLLRDAQDKVLQPHRRRANLTSLEMVPWLESEVRKIIEEDFVDSGDLRSDLESQNTVIEQLQHDIAELHERLQSPVLSKVSTGTLIDELLSRSRGLFGAGFGALLETLASRQEAQIPGQQVVIHNTVESPKKTKRKTKILIVGAMATQFADIVKACSAAGIGEHCVFQHLNVEGGRSFRRQDLPQADFAVAMTKFIDHSTQGLLIEKFGRSNVLLHHGGTVLAAKLIIERSPGFSAN